MYLSKLESPSGVAVQGLVRIADAWQDARWHEELARRSMALESIGELTSSIRIGLDREGRITRLLGIATPATAEGMLRRYLAGIAWLDVQESDIVELPSEKSEFEEWADALPAERLLLRPAALSVRDCFIATDFRLAPHLTDLFSQARSLGFAVAYQASFAPCRQTGEVVRETGYNTVRLRQIKGVPDELIRLQESIAARVGTARLRLEELIAVDGAEARTWLERFVTNAASAYAAKNGLRETPGELAPPVDVSDPTLMVHSSLLYGEPFRAGFEADSGELRKSLLEWRPPAGIDRQPPPSAPPSAPGHGPQFPPSGEPPPPPSAKANHVFVSYKREDMPAISAALALLDRAGIPIWYDGGIPGGSEWDAVLEQKIETSAAVLAFISQAAVESKYCRRELKYADAVNKQIVGILIGQVNMRHGLAFMLQQLQMINFAEPNRDHRVLDALKRATGKI